MQGKKGRNLRDFTVFGTPKAYKILEGGGGFNDILRVLTMGGGRSKIPKKRNPYVIIECSLKSGYCHSYC